MNTKSTKTIAAHGNISRGVGGEGEPEDSCHYYYYYYCYSRDTIHEM